MYRAGIRLLEITYNADGTVPDKETADNIRMLVQHFENRMYIGQVLLLTQSKLNSHTKQEENSSFLQTHMMK